MPRVNLTADDKIEAARKRRETNRRRLVRKWMAYNGVANIKQLGRMSGVPYNTLYYWLEPRDIDKPVALRMDVALAVANALMMDGDARVQLMEGRCSA